MQDIGHGLHQLGLAHAGNAFEQHVASREQTGHDAGNNLLVADDHARNFVAHQQELLTESLDFPVDDHGVHFFSLSCKFRK